MIEIEKVKIRFSNAEKLVGFVNICGKYDCDINIYYKSKMFDAKSILALYSIGLTVVMEVEIVSDNEEVIKKFREEIKEYMD